MMWYCEYYCIGFGWWRWKLCSTATAAEENHFTPVQGSYQSLYGCENIRCLASSSFWAFVKCRQF